MPTMYSIILLARDFYINEQLSLVATWYPFLQENVGSARSPLIAQNWVEDEIPWSIISIRLKMWSPGPQEFLQEKNG